MIKKGLLLLVLLEVFGGCVETGADNSSYQQLLNGDGIKIEDECVSRCVEDGTAEATEISIEYDEMLQKAVKRIRATIANHNAKPRKLNP